MRTNALTPMSQEIDYAEAERLVHSLARPEAFPHPAHDVECVETHISWVLLAGDYAYKLKKPLELGFLDFSTLARRRAACDAEVRLNRRHAPELYLDVVPVTGTRVAPRIGGEGEAIEWAVRMRRFDRDQELDRLLARGALHAERIDELAVTVARFHASAAVASLDAPWGTAETVLVPCLANFERLGRMSEDPGVAGRLESLRSWTLAEHERLRSTFADRRAARRVRECHGDLHLANMVLHGERVVVFDCIEFSESLRWIDVAAEIAFTIMDLRFRDRTDLAQRFLDGYLAESGDYALLAVLDFYLVYRAMVRAKIAAIRAVESDVTPEEQRAARDDFLAHLALAESLVAPRTAALVITHGVSGSGKSFAAERLVEQGPWIRVRSDVERKRLAGLGPRDVTVPERRGVMYSRDAGERTYAHLAEVAAVVLAARYPVIVDATFLERARRARFAALAAQLGVPFVILVVSASGDVLRARVAARAQAASDPSEADLAVLERQLAAVEPLAPGEAARAVRVASEDAADGAALAARLAAFLGHGTR
jgi:aminoglycoside phosphotransferase family enzyme/predicted kinase